MELGPFTAQPRFPGCRQGEGEDACRPGSCNQHRIPVAQGSRGGRDRLLHSPLAWALHCHSQGLGCFEVFSSIVSNPGKRIENEGTVTPSWDRSSSTEQRGTVF